MPYFFLNIVADMSNFYGPTPIILSGDKLNEVNIVKTLCTNVIANETGCSAYLLSIPLAELLGILENEGYKTVKVNRSGNHNIWVLHKDSTGDTNLHINNSNHQRVPVGQESYVVEENSSSLSSDPFKDINFECFKVRTGQKSEKSQTTAVRWLASEDFTSIVGVQCHIRSSVVDASNGTADENPYNRQQNPTNPVDFKNSTKIGCQYDGNIKDEWKYQPEKSYKCVTSQNNNIKCSIKTFSSETVNLLNDISDNTSEIDKSDIKKENTQDGFVEHVKPDTATIALIDATNADSKNSLSQSSTSHNEFENSISFNQDNEFLWQRSSKDKLNKAHDILTKLEKRFQNEHDYFSNVRIKKMKNKEIIGKKTDDRNMIVNNGTVTLANLKIDDTRKTKDETKEITLNSGQGEHCKKLKVNVQSGNDQVRQFKLNYNFKLNPLSAFKSKQHKSTESVTFYEAMDSTSAPSKKGSQNNVLTDLDQFKDDSERPKETDYVEKCNTNVREKIRKLSSLKKHCVDSIECSSRIESVVSLENIQCVDRFDQVGLNSGKSRFRLECLDKNNNIDCSGFDCRKNSSSDCLTKIKKLETVRNKLQTFANKQRVDFSTRFVQRTGNSTFSGRTRNTAVTCASERNRSQSSKELRKSVEDFADLKVKKTVKTLLCLKKEKREVRASTARKMAFSRTNT